MTTFTEKPTSYTVDTGNAYCPDHLYMIDEGSGTTLTDLVGTLDLTLNTDAVWSTTDLTAGGGTSPCAVLTSDYARNTGLSLTSSICIVALVKSSSATNPGSNQHIVSAANSANTTDFINLRFDTSGRISGIYDDSVASSVVQNSGADTFDTNWHLAAFKAWQNGADVKVGASYDGGVWTTATGTTVTGVWNTLNRLCIGASGGSSLGNYFEGEVAAVFVYKDDSGSWDNTWIAAVYNGGDPWQFLTPAAAPAFTVPATVTSQTSTVYTIGFTPDSSCTIYGVAVVAGSAAPSVAQVKLGQNGAGGAAKANNSKAVTGADSFTLTPSDSPAFPCYDLYCVLSNASGDSALRTIAGEYLDAPTAKSFVTLTSLDATSPFYGTGAAIADTVVIDTATDPGLYVVTCAVDGTVSYPSGGDDSRQLVDADVYDYSAGAYLGAGVLVFNNLSPDQGTLIFDSSLLYQKDVAIDTVALDALAPDPEGDTVTATALDALPAGLSITASDLSGTPTVYGDSTVTLQWEDQYGATYTEDVLFQIGDLVPNVVNVVEATAVAAIEAVASLTTTVTTASSPTIATGNVISTDPPAGTLVVYNADISVVVSSGSSLAITTTTLSDGTRDVAYIAALAANGSVTTWSVDAGNLPTGLTLDNSSGIISGIPTVAGSYAFTIGATNGAASDTQALTLTITGIAPTITTTELTQAVEGEAYTAQIVATGDATITYAVTTGALPLGLSLSTSGAITGTPTELGGNAFTVTATNDEGSDTQALGLSVVQASLGYVLTLKPLRNRINLRRRRDA